MNEILGTLNMSFLDLILYTFQVMAIASIVGLPISFVLLYGLHLIDCVREPSRNDWKFWR